MSRLDTQWAGVAGQVELVRQRLAPALRHAATVAADGWPLRADSAGRSTSTTTSVEAAVIARTTGTGSGYLVADHVAALELLARQVATLVAEAIDHLEAIAPPPGLTPRCTGGMGLPGHEAWGDPTCRNVPDGRPSRAGMCDACWQRQRRWQQREVA